MINATTQALCTRCGVCCGGTIFADVELGDETEASGLELLGLEIEEEEGRWLLIQPCRALKNSSCTIYQYRPKCCRRFECKLLNGVQSGASSVREALGVVQLLRKKLAEQDQETSRAIINARFLNRAE